MRRSSGSRQVTRSPRCWRLARAERKRAARGAKGAGRRVSWAGPVVAAALAGAVLLAIFRAEEISPAERLALDGKVWWAWPTAVVGAVLAGQMVGLSLFSRRGWAPLGAGLVAAVLLLLLWLRFPSLCAAAGAHGRGLRHRACCSFC